MKMDIKDKLLTALVLLEVASLIAVFLIIDSCNKMEYIIEQQSEELGVYRSHATEKVHTRDVIDKLNLFDKINNTPSSTEDIEVTTPVNTYEFTDMNLKGGRFVSENNLWYITSISPYISPGVGFDMYIRGDNDEYHYIKMHLVNTEKKDVTASGCKIYTLGVHMLDGFSIGGIAIGDYTEDVVHRIGEPDAYSVSDYDAISYLRYDYGDFEVNARGSVVNGRIEYVEVVCKDVKGFENGK